MTRGLSGAALLAVVVPAATLACSSVRRVPPPPPAPVVQAPADAIPGDLDVVVRLDLAAMKGALGQLALRELEARALGSASAEALVGAALRRADTAWFAFRPGLPPELTDNVLVLRGDFADLEAPSPPWALARDLGGGFRRLDHEAPAGRAQPARLYRRDDDLLVFVSEAELDSVELVLERGATVDRVEAPNEGALAVAARAPILARLVYADAPAAARLLDQARLVSAHVELTAAGLAGELDVEFREPTTADDAARASRVLGAALKEQGGPLATVLEGVDISAVGTSLVVRVELEAAALGALVEGSADE